MMWEAATYTGDITAAARDRIAVLPTGSPEFHGPHGYLGVDSLIADDLARRVAGSLDGLLLPRVDYTWCPAPTRGYPGTISVPQDVMQAGRYRSLVVRCGQRKATIAVGHTILRFVYHILATHEPYNERTLFAHDERWQARAKQRALAQLSALGYEVTLTPTAPAA